MENEESSSTHGLMWVLAASCATVGAPAASTYPNRCMFCGRCCCVGNSMVLGFFLKHGGAWQQHAACSSIGGGMGEFAEQTVFGAAAAAVDWFQQLVVFNGSG